MAAPIPPATTAPACPSIVANPSLAPLLAPSFLCLCFVPVMTLTGHVLLSPDDCSCFVFPPGDFLLQCHSSSPLHRVASTTTTASSSSITPRVRFLHHPSGGNDKDDNDNDSIMLAFPKSKNVPKKGCSGQPPSSASHSSFGAAATTVDPYQVLQIRRDATALEIRHAYMRLALWHHPGRTTLGSLTPPEKARRRQVFEVLAACYETLIDKATRARCDALLREAEPLPSPPTASGRPDGEGGGGVGANAPRRRRIKRRMLVGRLLLPSESHDSHHSRHGTVIPSLSSVSLDSCSTDDSTSSSGCDEDDNDEMHGGRTDGLGMTTTTNGTSIHPTFTSTPGSGYPMDKVDSRGDRSLKSHSSIQKQRTGSRQVQQPRFAQTLHQWLCGAPSISVEDDEDGVVVVHKDSGKKAHNDRRTTAPSPAAASSASSSSSERHFSERETNRLFGGPLFLLFRARRWKPLTDPYRVFADVFGTDLNGSSGRPLPSLRALQPTSPAAAVPVRPSAAWTGSSERQALPDGTNALVCTTTRVWPDRVLIRTETIRNGRRQITVTSEPRLHPDANETTSYPMSSSPLTLCGTCDFQLCLWE